MGKTLQLEDDSYLAPSAEAFHRATRRLADLTVEIFGHDGPLPLAATQVDACAATLRYQPNDQNTLDLLQCLSDLTAELRYELDLHPAARAWYADRDLRDLTGAMFEFCGAAPDSEWTSLPERLDGIAWVQSTRRELARDLRLAECDRAALGRQDAGRLAETVERMRPAIEGRAREFWIALRCGSAGGCPVQEIYSRAWTDLLAPARVSFHDVERAAARCRAAAEQFRLTELADFLDPSERVFQYALFYLIAPAPIYWRMDSAGRVEEFLDGQLARWHNRPFHHRLRPLEMIAPVLRAGRPLYFDRISAHALLQYQILQTFLTPSKEYFEILGRLEKNFTLLFEAYLLRLEWLPRLKSAEGWAGYLAELLDRCFGNRTSTALWSAPFPSERGLSGAYQVLSGPDISGILQ